MDWSRSQFRHSRFRCRQVRPPSSRLLQHHGTWLALKLLRFRDSKWEWTQGKRIILKIWRGQEVISVVIRTIHASVISKPKDEVWQRNSAFNIKFFTMLLRDDTGVIKAKAFGDNFQRFFRLFQVRYRKMRYKLACAGLYFYVRWPFQCVTLNYY